MSDFNEEPQANPPRRGIKKGIYIIPSAFTIGNILCGFYAVINSAKAYQLLDDPGQLIQANPSVASHLLLPNPQPFVPTVALYSDKKQTQHERQTQT